MQPVSLIDNVTFLLTLQFLIQILVKYATLSHSLPVPIGDLRFFFQKFSSIQVSDKLSIPACPKLTRRRTLKQRWSFIDRRGEFIRLLKPWRTKRFRYLSTRCFVRPALFMRVSDIQEVPRYLSRLGTFKRFALSATSRTSLRNFTEETRALGSWKYL